MDFSIITKAYSDKMVYLNYSPNTIQVYSHYVLRFLVKVNKYPQHIVASDYSDYLAEFKFSSVSQQNQIINAIKFLYERILKKKYNKVDFTRPRKEKRLPQVIDKDFILEQLTKVDNIKHKAIISLAFSVGLRVSEIINLKINDIDSNRMIITIRQAKGRKDRIVPLSQTILELLRNYYRQYKPVEYLFNGQGSLIKYSPSSCNQIIKKYLGHDYHFHLLRHSCFSSLVDSGTDISIIKELAGHNSIKTTTIYLHTSKRTLANLPLPI